MREDQPIWRDTTLSREEDADKSGPYLKTKVMIERTECRINHDFPEDAKCDCGHAYYRHFDPYEDWSPVGCKYCQCHTWIEPVQKAGLIPYYMDMGTVHMMFMIPSDPKFGGSHPQIAKGCVDPTDGSSKHAAIREAQEELGFDLENVEYGELGVRTIVKDKIKDEKEYTFALYVAEVKDRQDFNEPHFETGSVVWLTPLQFQHYGKPEHRDLVKKAFVEIGLYHGYELKKPAPGYEDFPEVY